MEEGGSKHPELHGLCQSKRQLLVIIYQIIVNNQTAPARVGIATNEIIPSRMWEVSDTSIFATVRLQLIESSFTVQPPPWEACG